jgi:hypothetical protein
MKPIAYAIRQAVLNKAQRQDLKRRIGVAFESLQKGKATTLDVNDIINAGNICIAMAEFIAELEEYVPAINAGLGALEAMGARFNGRWVLVGDECAAITGMLDVHDIILSSPQLTRGMFSEAAARVRAKIIAGEVRGASIKPPSSRAFGLKEIASRQRKAHRCNSFGRAVQHAIQQRQRASTVSLS